MEKIFQKEVLLGFIFFQALVCGLFTSVVANKKGYSKSVWFGAGFLFSIIGLISAVGLPKKKKKSKNFFEKNCPKCAEFIKREAVICKYCHNEFSKRDIIKELLNSLKTQDVYRQTKALEELQTINDSTVTDHLVVYLNKNIGIVNDSMLQLTIDILSQLNEPSTAKKLIPIVNKSKEYLKRTRLISFIGRFQDPETLNALIKWIQEPKLRKISTKIILEFGELALPYLEGLAQGSKKNKKLAYNIISNIKDTIKPEKLE